MAVIKAKPTSAGRRFVQTVKTSNLHKGRPHKSLTTGLKKTGGRNNYGRMTTGILVAGIRDSTVRLILDEIRMMYQLQ